MKKDDGAATRHVPVYMTPLDFIKTGAVIGAAAGVLLYSIAHFIHAVDDTNWGTKVSGIVAMLFLVYYDLYRKKNLNRLVTEVLRWCVAALSVILQVMLLGGSALTLILVSNSVYEYTAALILFTVVASMLTRFLITMTSVGTNPSRMYYYMMHGHRQSFNYHSIDKYNVLDTGIA